MVGGASVGFTVVVVLWLYAGATGRGMGALVAPVVVAVILWVAWGITTHAAATVAQRRLRPPFTASWFRVHPALGLEAVDVPRRFPVPPHRLDPAWHRLGTDEQRELETRFFGELLGALVERGTTYVAVVDDAALVASMRLALGVPGRGTRLAGALTPAAVRAFAHAVPRRLLVSRGTATLLAVYGDWTGANVALTTHERARLTRRMADVGFDVASA